MKVNYQQALTACAALALAGVASLAHAAPITGWAVQKNPSAPSGSDPTAPAAIANAHTNNPTITTADNELAVMGTFGAITLANAGDYITFNANVQLLDRTAFQTGANALSTQLRFGVFSGPLGAVALGDGPNNGLVGQYSNLPAQGNSRLRSQATGNVDPFLNSSLTNVVDGSADAGADTISGANTPVIVYTMTITRNAGGTLDIAGTISGGAYSSSFSATNFASAALPSGGPFTFNRAGMWFGNNVNATTAEITDATVTTNVPEPGTCILGAMAGLACFGLRRRGRRTTS